LSEYFRSERIGKPGFWDVEQLPWYAKIAIFTFQFVPHDLEELFDWKREEFVRHENVFWGYCSGRASKIGNVLNMESGEGFSAVILAAGLSERMGVPKLSLRYQGGVSFAAHCVSGFLDSGCRQVALVVNEEGFHWMATHVADFPAEVRVVINSFPEFGRLYSLEQGLLSLDELLPAFLHNVDNPFVSPVVLQALKTAYSEIIPGGQGPEADHYFSPVFDGRGGHPVLISPGVVKAILKKGTHPTSLKAFLSGFPRLRVPVTDPHVLVNINTMEDYQCAGLPLQ
jgi:molybdenum cofactor cytidylyltransferase